MKGTFSIAKDRSECLVSNSSAGLGGDDILLTRGLAEDVTLRILFYPEKNSGLLEVLLAKAPVMVDRRIVHHSTQLRDGALIRLSSRQAIRCRFSEGILDEERTMVHTMELVGAGHMFAGGSQAFEGLSLSVERGDLIGIMGPSGCGKSSLLTAMSGYLKPKKGKVLLNGLDIYEHRNSLLSFIAHMPQEEALCDHLTVREHLRHAMMVRRPQLSLAEQNRRVDVVINELGLRHRSDAKVGSSFEKHLSGGERGRLDLGLDFGSTAEVLLIDEPTSGLSSKDSEHVMQTLRTLSQDKIVVCSLHAPSARLLHQLDKVLLLDQGGRAAYFGTPAEMITYFKDAADELNLTIESKKSGREGADFVFDVLEAQEPLESTRLKITTRRFSPEFWQKRFSHHQAKQKSRQNLDSKIPVVSQPVDVLAPPQSRRFRAILSLAFVYLQRAFFTKFRSRGTLYTVLLEAPLLAGLIAFSLRASPQTSYEFGTALNIPIFLFLAVTVAMFLGLTNSATEILRDGALLRRERNTRQVVSLYIAAKFVTVITLATLQAATFLIVAHFILEIQGMFFHHWGWMILTSCSGSALALFISALVKSERAALSAVPLILVPQMLLAGALVPFDEMNRGLFTGGGVARDAGAEPVPARIMPLRYAFEGILVTQALENPFAALRKRAQGELDALKKLKELTVVERQRLNFLRDFLLRIHVAEASNAEEAWALLRQFSQAYDHDPEADSKSLKQIKILQNAGKDHHPFGEYFASERVDSLTSQAEIKRKDYRRENTDTHDVFFASHKRWLGRSVQARTASAMALSVTTIMILFITVFAIRWRYRIRL